MRSSHLPPASAPASRISLFHINYSSKFKALISLSESKIAIDDRSRSRSSSFPNQSIQPPNNNNNMNPNAQQQLNNNVGFPQPNNMLQNQPLENLNNQDHNLEHFLRPLLWRMLLGQPQGQQFPFMELWWMPRIPGAAMPYPMMLAATYGIYIDHPDDHYQGHQRYSMDTVRGNVITVAKEHDGSVFLRRTLKDGSQEDINDIFLEMKTDLCSLMLHRFAKLVVTKLIDAVDHRKLDEIIDLLITDIRFNQICDDYHGTEVVKTLAGRLRSDNAGVVFCRCLKSFSPQYKQELATAIAENCLHIGQDSCGFRLMLKCLDEANDTTNFA
ncbi:hypothetical protein TIFTF001_007125 [Ficus carica]|uniref:PUM-HD domain-containing protein n=1 Tax=Ficus carica TaxID=3494 RepID=A0AA88A5S5_FICCA|nr:hypothetical protein TIFTF001_007125 [Ficus carica]